MRIHCAARTTELELASTVLKRMSIYIVLVALVVTALLSFFAFFIAGPENFEKIFTRDRVVRTLEVTALVSYRGRPIHLSARTVCWTPGDYFRAVSMEARPQQVASALPDGSVIAFRGMTHLCRYAEKAITAELGAASGPRVLRRQTPVPALPAIWFSKPRNPDLIEESIEPCRAGAAQPAIGGYSPRSDERRISGADLEGGTAQTWGKSRPRPCNRLPGRRRDRGHQGTTRVRAGSQVKASEISRRHAVRRLLGGRGSGGHSVFSARQI